ncbi:MAG: hypothetical protein EA402_06900 [Planctomycetota bacterium]|nr:MAG: hypothetical protein EA402_06900 [Planctomycetota bacterium]
MTLSPPSWRSVFGGFSICAVAWGLAALLLSAGSPLLGGLAFLPFIIGLFAFMAGCGALWRRLFPRPAAPPLPPAGNEAAEPVPDYPPGESDDDSPALVPSGGGDGAPPRSAAAARPLPKVGEDRAD